MSECGGAGTGCMWCVPILKKIWNQESTDDLTAEEYAARRQRYIERGKVRESP
jgi:NAD(P)H-nitrite reductase large subunit